MIIKLSGQPVGSPYENKKKTGFIQQMAIMNGSAIDAITSVFASKLSDLTPDDKGVITVNCSLPDFMMVAR